jgi:hypothetical protein
MQDERRLRQIMANRLARFYVDQILEDVKLFLGHLTSIGEIFLYGNCSNAII